MGESGDWIKRPVPKERCEEKRRELEAMGWTVAPECPEDPEDSRQCVLSCRQEYDD